jgi:hypothetical protein
MTKKPGLCDNICHKTQTAKKTRFLTPGAIALQTILAGTVYAVPARELIAFLLLMKYMKDPPKSPLTRGTGQVPPLLRGARGDRVNVPHETFQVPPLLRGARGDRVNVPHECENC